MKCLRWIVVFFWLCAGSAQAGLLDQITGRGGEPEFLAADQAFGLEVASRDAGTLVASFRVEPGYYLYRSRTSFSALSGGKLGSVDFPAGETKDDPNLGRQEVYHHSFQVRLAVSDTQPGQPLVIKATYQGCSEQGLCYPPQDQTVTVNLEQTLSAAPPEAEPQTENSRIADILGKGSFWVVVSFFFGAGVLLSFTPCVFPMVPILSGIIVGHGHKVTHRHAFLLSLAYVLGMAITYAAAGVAAGMSGELISNALQTPWVLGSFAALFVLLSLSMFGFYELQLPSALQSRLTDSSNRLHGGHFTGVFAMGALSAVIMSPCVAAPMAGALLYIGQTHDAVLGGVALFSMALGMGVPLLMIGTSAGALLPRAGAWMEAVKRMFGVLMLAVAIWIVSPLLSVSVQMGLWAVLLILSGMRMHALDTLPAGASGWLKVGRGVGLVLTLVGVAYLIGALSGAQDILRPLGALTAVRAEARPALQFERVKSSAALDARLAQLRGKPVMLDFYADWCVACKEMDRFTFSDPRVQERLKSAVLLQVDVTANNEDDKALLKRFELFGPPATLFFDGNGDELRKVRLVGFQKADPFLDTLKRAGL
jgi:thiol:disulfide interchange protein DsbD